MEDLNLTQTYDGLYLKKVLKENNDPRANDEQFIIGRVERSTKEFERQRLAGMAVDQAQEISMHVLLDGLFDEEDDQ